MICIFYRSMNLSCGMVQGNFQNSLRGNCTPCPRFVIFCVFLCHREEKYTFYAWIQGRNKEIFLGAKPLFPIFSRCEVTFPDFSRRDFSLFPVEISILVDPKKSFTGFLKLKVKSKKKNKSSSAFSVIFHLTFFIFLLPFYFLKIFSNFHLSFFHFSLNISHFFTFFPLCLIFPD